MKWLEQFDVSSLSVLYKSTFRLGLASNYPGTEILFCTWRNVSQLVPSLSGTVVAASLCPFPLSPVVTNVIFIDPSFMRGL